MRACRRQRCLSLNFRSSDVHFVNSEPKSGYWVVPDSYLSVVFVTECVLHIALFAVKKVWSSVDWTRNRYDRADHGESPSRLGLPAQSAEFRLRQAHSDLAFFAWN